MFTSSTRAVSAWLEHPVFAAAGEALCVELAARYPISVVPGGASILRPNETDVVHVLLGGGARATERTADDRELLVLLMGAPAIIGDVHALGQVPLGLRVYAFGHAQIARIAADDYKKLLLGYPALMGAQMRHQAALLSVLRRNHQHLAAALEHRLASLLLALAELGAEVAEDGSLKIIAPLDQEFMADALGSVRRSIGPTIATWRKAGIVRKQGRHFYLCNPEELEQIASAARGSLYYRCGMPLSHLSARPRRNTASLRIAGEGTDTGREVVVDGQILIGATPSAQLQLDHPEVAARHCRVFAGRTGNRFWLEQIGPGTTEVNGKTVHRSVLRDGDEIRVGDAAITVHIAKDAESSLPAQTSIHA